MEQYSHRNFPATKRSAVNQNKKKEKKIEKEAQDKRHLMLFVIGAEIGKVLSFLSNNKEKRKCGK